jgi:arsenite/tail-anchored protein-transporting ATPase
MPEALTDWLAWIFRLWIKYQDVVGQTELMGRLRSLRQQVVQTQKKLKDPIHTEFISVIQTQQAVIAETERLIQSLTEMGIYQRYLVQNRYVSTQKKLDNQFQQTIVQLPELPGAVPSAMQVQMAAQLLFQASHQASH